VGLEGTAPFHWDGDMASFDTLVKEVFVHRMGGPVETPERTAALSKWVFALTPRAPIVDAAAEGAVRGRALFESTSVGCATCHAGEKLTTNGNAEVGTTERGHALQVPSLRGVGYRAPFLHDGRAATLLERFDPKKGGGDAHGHTSGLSPAQLGDLVSYLESL
jgi:mono/diheme cytochrome c family protein